MGIWLLRVAVAILLPALALEATFPVMESFTTVYNGSTEFLPALVFSICLLLVPAMVLGFWVRSNLLYAIGVAVFVVQSVGVAVQIAKTDDAQAGLAALGLPFYTGFVAVVLVGLDAYLRRRRRGSEAAFAEAVLDDGDLGFADPADDPSPV